MYAMERVKGKESWKKLIEKKLYAYHRKRGPAIKWRNGGKSWYDNGFPYEKIEDECFCATFARVSSVKIELHSFSDSPAICYKNGTKEWYRHDKLHRINGPAIVYLNGDEEWYFMGQRHRREGPAVTYGNKQYFFECGEFVKFNHLN
ncbi:MAG: hypothetical protein EKK64_06655 [Neisseriaceae bacterium]|nr:MAG: hypothetical protein EKK64_06655 [Neisseriaceae bacterium]